MVTNTSHKAKKSFGQHFLDHNEIFQYMLPEDDTTTPILEIGPGTGNLTAFLEQQGYNVYAIEKDRTLIPQLQKRFEHSSHCTITYGDALTTPLPSFCLPHYRLIANIPYYITQPIIHRFLWEIDPKPIDITLMVQHEVAEKYTQKKAPFTYTAATTQLIAESNYIAFVPRHFFSPPPKVDSAILQIKLRAEDSDPCLPSLLTLMGTCFRQGRKKLENTIPRSLQQRLPESARSLLLQRPEMLSREDWLTMGNLIFSQK